MKKVFEMEVCHFAILFKCGAELLRHTRQSQQTPIVCSLVTLRFRPSAPWMQGNLAWQWRSDIIVTAGVRSLLQSLCRWPPYSSPWTVERSMYWHDKVCPLSSPSCLSWFFQLIYLSLLQSSNIKRTLCSAQQDRWLWEIKPITVGCLLKL